MLDARPEQYQEAIKENNLTGVVVAACSPRLHEPTFRAATKDGGLNPFRFEMANIREQNSWVHMHDQAGATEKAKDAIRIAVAKASLLEDLYPKSVPVEHAAMVVGAGVAGMQAALDLANAGIKTYLIEKEPSIGGRMSQLDKTFPTLDCSQCILTPKMVDVGRAENIVLMVNAEVEEVEGYIGNFDVTIRRKATGVLSPKEAEAKGIVGGGCTGCGDCVPVCPVTKPNEFEMGMAPRKAIYIYHPQVVPLLYTIDFDSCVKCGLCVETCGDKKAIDLEMQDELVKVKVGTVILATGYEIFPIENKEEWGYKRYDNVITSLEFERLICASGPTGGHLVRPSDGETPMRVAFVLCAGSRDTTAWASRTAAGSAACTRSSTPTRSSKRCPGSCRTSSTWTSGPSARRTRSSTTGFRKRARSSSAVASRTSRRTPTPRTSSSTQRTRSSAGRWNSRSTWSCSPRPCSRPR